jgi:hypothetical protein
MSDFDASVDSLTPVRAIIVTSSLLSAGISAIISPVSPEYEISKTIDFFVPSLNLRELLRQDEEIY